MYEFFKTSSGFKRLSVGSEILDISTKTHIQDALYKAYTNKFKKELDQSERKNLIKELKALLEEE